MGLLANGFRDTLGAFRTFGATASNNAYPSTGWAGYARTGAMRNISAGEGITDDKVGRPSGNRHPSTWMLPQKAGALSSHNNTQGSSTATLSLASGRNIAASATGSASATATLQLVVSLLATAAGSASVTGNINAALGLSGSSAGSCTATAAKGAIGWVSGSSAGSCTATLVPYATGQLAGSISPFTELSPQSLAASLLEYAQATPIHSDVRKINDAAVTGAGTSGDKWRG